MPNILEMIDRFLNLKFANELTVEVVCFRLILAIILGGIVGYEREKNNRPAGFRTHILVCFGAAIVSMVQDQLRLNILDLARTEGTAVASVIKTDLGRLGAQVISGVGFLGAGSIMKEKGETETRTDNLVFPCDCSRSVMSAKLSIVGKACGIRERLSYHMARHTFGTMSLSAGIPIESIAKMMGHASIASTQIYAQVTDNKISEDMDRLIRKHQKEETKEEAV